MGVRRAGGCRIAEIKELETTYRSSESRKVFHMSAPVVQLHVKISVVGDCLLIVPQEAMKGAMIILRSVFVFPTSNDRC